MLGQFIPETTVSTELAAMQMQLNAIKPLLLRAAERGDQLALQNIQAAYTIIVKRMDALRKSVSTREMPSELLRRWDAVGDDILRTGQQITRAVGGVASGVGATIKILPLLLIGGLVVLGIGLSKGTLGYRR